MSRFRVANGRIGKDQSEGNITCYTKGNNIVDYLLIKGKDFIKVKDFEISEINELSADDCYLNIKLHVNFSQDAHETTHEILSAESTPDDVLTDVEEFLKITICIRNVLNDKICETLNSDKLRDELSNLDTNLNDI